MFTAETVIFTSTGGQFSFSSSISAAAAGFSLQVPSACSPTVRRSCARPNNNQVLAPDTDLLQCVNPPINKVKFCINRSGAVSPVGGNQIWEHVRSIRGIPVHCGKASLPKPQMFFCFFFHSDEPDRRSNQTNALGVAHERLGLIHVHGNAKVVATATDSGISFLSLSSGNSRRGTSMSRICSVFQ